MRRTKIVCTLGPSSTNREMLCSMFRNGMNIARLNFSHGTQDTHRKAIELVKSVREELKIPAAIMLDTRGPEIRLKTVKEGSAVLKKGDKFVLTAQDCPGDATRVSITYSDLPKQLCAGNRVLIDDGKIILRVEDCTETEINTVVEEGGEIKDHKGINIPNVHIDMPYISESDAADLRFGVEMDVDFIAASFVRSKEDVIELRKFINYYGGHKIKIISKIENIEGIDNFDEILEYSDGIMVARGDMGVEVEYERLPGLQKKFIRRCYQSGKVVITATQMLESMIHNYTPTRAEITDVANAVFDGTSAVMLSGETAMGDHPARVVEVMAKIAEQAEKDAFEMHAYKGFKHDVDYSDITNAICDAACTTAKDVSAKTIIAVTKSGHTARRMSKFRPEEPIVASTPELKTFHQLAMSWGVYPVLALNQEDIEKLFTHAIDCAKQIDLVSAGDKVVITAGAPLNMTGTTNLLKVQEV